MRRLLIQVAAVLVLSVPGVCAEPVTVTIYHTADLHEHSKALPRIAKYVADKKKADPNTMLVDSGDWNNKGDLTALKTRGEVMVAAMTAMGYDAMIPGNHDFSFGARRLASLIDKYSPPVLAANITWTASIKPQRAARYRIVRLKGVSVGIIGTAPPFIARTVAKDAKIAPIVKGVRDLVEQVGKRADIVVLVTHVGPNEDRKIMKALPRIDVVLGGHHHKKFEKVDFDATTKTVLQHSGQNGSAMGEVVLTWDGSKISERSARLIKITDSMKECEKVRGVIDRFVKAKATK